jgi:hypothetical protein
VAYNAVPKKKMKGFSFFKFVLVLVILAILGGTGYYVNYAKKQTLNTLDSANAITAKTVPAVSKGPSVKLTENWSGYSNQEGSFSLKYPNKWVQPLSRKLCPTGTFDSSIYLGPNTSSVLKCGYSGQVVTVSQVVVSSYIGDQRSTYKLNPSNFSGVNTVNYGINGVVGVKQTGEVSNPAAPKYKSYSSPQASTSPVSLSTTALPNGTFIERYIFYTNNNTYVAQYLQEKSGSSDSSDVLSDFDLMISKTLQFHS